MCSKTENKSTAKKQALAGPGNGKPIVYGRMKLFKKYLWQERCR